MTPISFFVTGEPRGQPRPRAFARKIGSTFVARVYDARTAEGWKSQIADAAKPFLPITPLTGPLRIDVTFYFPRPKSHFRTGKHCEDLRSDAPTWHTSRPDRDNLDKAVLDCLQTIGMISDDANVVCGTLEKRYVNPPYNPPGCSIFISTV